MIGDMPRFTRDGSDALEALLHEACDEIGSEIIRIIPASRFQCLLLGGGYGRGEGGVLKKLNGEAPYNDMEFFLLIRGHPRLNEKRYGVAIHGIEQRMTEWLGIEVEFKILSLDQLRASATSMFYYDLICGHRVIVGPTDALAGCGHHGAADSIPLHEATRLMMNRCSGLLFAAERLEKDDFTPEDHDFVARNIAKAELALGDVVLASLGHYHWSCLEREKRLASITEEALPMSVLREFHRDGVAFKLRPYPQGFTRERLRDLHKSVTDAAWLVWAWQEDKRLGMTVKTPAAYALHPASKCPESRFWKNPLIRLRVFGAKGLSGRMAFRYPREGLLNVLSLMLWDPGSVEHHADWLSSQLVSDIRHRDDAIAAYEKLWHRFN